MKHLQIHFEAIDDWAEAKLGPVVVVFILAVLAAAFTIGA